jgi:hypothetical protein
MRIDAGTINDENKKTVVDLCELQTDYPDDLAFTLITSSILKSLDLQLDLAIVDLEKADLCCVNSPSTIIRLHLGAEVDVALGKLFVDCGRYTEGTERFRAALKKMESRFVFQLVLFNLNFKNVCISLYFSP